MRSEVHLTRSAFASCGQVLAYALASCVPNAGIPRPRFMRSLMATTESVLPRQLQGLNITPAAVIAAFLISSAVWIVNDERAWSWDPAWYGDWTLRLWQARQSGLVAWASAMLHALGAQQPLMTWLGQFFVPLRRFTGEFESAILFVNLFTAAGTLTLIYCISRRLGADVLSSLIGVMV